MHSMSVLSSSVISIRLSVAILECWKLICMHLICVCILFDLLQCIVLALRKPSVSVIRVDLYAFDLRLHFVRSIAVYCVRVAKTPHFSNPCFALLLQD